MPKDNRAQIIQYQHDFCLYPTENEGGVIWKMEKDLMLAILVGQDIDGEKYIVHNQPNKLNYNLNSLKKFQREEYCFCDLNNQRYDYHAIALQAFQLLYQFNDYNNNTYDVDYKLVLPEKELYKAPTFKENVQETYKKAVDPLRQWLLNFWESITGWYKHLGDLSGKTVQPQLKEAVQPLLLADTYRIQEEEQRLSA